MWNDKYKLNKCINCGTNEIPYKANGLCRRCYMREHNRIYRQKPSRKAYMLLYSRKWSKTEKAQKYHREYYKEYIATQRKKSSKFRIDENIGSLIYRTLKGIKAGRKWEGLVGYSIDELMAHLERQFDNKMMWENYGAYWHVDHIKPRSLFYYKTTDDLSFKECWALNNLQPLEKIANLKKSNKFQLTRR